MNHTDFYKLNQRIKKQEYDELFLAVQAHGGCYQWAGGDDDEKPLIAVNPNSISPDPIDVFINKVEIVNGFLEIYGRDKNNDNEVDFGPEDVFTEGLGYIIDCISETDKVSDVTISMYDYKEVLADICYELGVSQVTINNNSRAFIAKTIEWADEFDRLHKNTDWHEVDYLNAIHEFTRKKIAHYKGHIYHTCSYCGHGVFQYEKVDDEKNEITLTCDNCEVEIIGHEADSIYHKAEKTLNPS